MEEEEEEKERKVPLLSVLVVVEVLVVVVFVVVDVVCLDLDGASAATKALLAALAETTDNGGNGLFTILISCGGSGGGITSRGDSGGATVGGAQISPFSEVSSEKTFTLTSLEICAQDKIEVRTDANVFCL